MIYVTEAQRDDMHQDEVGSLLGVGLANPTSKAQGPSLVKRLKLFGGQLKFGSKFENSPSSTYAQLGAGKHPGNHKSSSKLQRTSSAM